MNEPKEREAADKQQEKPEKEPAKKNPEKTRAMIFWGIIAGIVVLEVPIMYFMIRVTRPKTAQEALASQREDSLRTAMRMATSMGATTADAPIVAIVNIMGTDGERFLKVAVVLEYDDKQYKEFGAEAARRAPKLKNLLIELLSRMSLVELSEPNAKEMIRKEYMRIVNSTLPPEVGQITNVLFDQFIIQ